MEIPNGVKAALRALAEVPGTIEGAVIYASVAADSNRPSAVRKRATFKGKLLVEALARKEKRKAAARERVEAKKTEALTRAIADGFESVSEHKRWLSGEMIPGKPVPRKILSEKHGGALDANPYEPPASVLEALAAGIPEAPVPGIATPKSFMGGVWGPGRAPYSAVRKLNQETYTDKNGNRQPFRVTAEA